MRPSMVLDCDPGVDDAFAILCALRHADLVAVTTVCGNAPLEHTTRNARVVLELAGASVPVHAGADRPLVGSPVHADLHGDNGLGGLAYPEPVRPVEDEHAVDALARLATGDRWLVAVGPLTNLALALGRDPAFLTRWRGVVLMAGATTAGNVTASAEFNVYADPEAAAMVFAGGAHPTMVGLDLTHQVRCRAEHADALEAAGTPTARLGAGLLRSYLGWLDAERRLSEGALHDACAVLAVTHPELFSGQGRRVDVELAGTLTRGRTVVDVRPGPGSAPNAHVLETVDERSVMALVLGAAVHPR